MKKLYTIIFSTLLALLVVTGVAAFSVSPIGFKTTIEPGGKQNFSIQVNNNEKGKHKYSVNINSIRNTEEGKRYYESGADPAEFWAKAEPQKFSLSSGESQTVIITFNIPAGTAPGSHHLAIMVASESLSRGEIGLTARSAIPISLTVAGNVTEKLVLKKFEPVDKYTGKIIWPFNIEIYNEGTMEVQSAGWMQIKNMFGKEILSQPVVLGNAIYPQSLRRLQQNIEMPPGMWPGKYTAKLAVQFGASKTSIAAETVIWFFPVWLCGVGFVLVTILIIWLWKRRSISS
ncbi:MAG: hypothetical protein WC725_03420 [Patescibacteria group bacterium]|jgi:uncharacterized membrane protein